MDNRSKAQRPPKDWTAAAGRSNSSLIFDNLCHEVEGIILTSGFDLIPGRTDSVARVIVAT